MNGTARSDSSRNARTRCAEPRIRRYKLPMCGITGLARFRDRHQARDGAGAVLAGSQASEVSTFACPDCHGYHLEQSSRRRPIDAPRATARAEAFTASLASRKRRYVLVDIENPTRGANVSTGQVAAFWSVLTQRAPGIAPNDHMVVGVSRGVARRYRAAIHGANVKWVVGANAPDAADRALLAAIDLHRVARDFDELLIVSGDHAFADLARRARKFGLAVQVVTAQHPEQPSMLSRELAAVADVHTLVRLHASESEHGTTPSLDAATSRTPHPTNSQRIAA